MNKIHSTVLLSKLLAAVILTCGAGLTFNATAGDIPQSDPTAPCGVLHQQGPMAAIYNNSIYAFEVKFETKSATPTPQMSRVHINAGAVKYLAINGQGDGIWKDTGVGDYHTEKTYTIPVAGTPDGSAIKPVLIAYCEDVSNSGFGGAQGYLEGTVFFFKLSGSEGISGPVGGVRFNGMSRFPEPATPNLPVAFYADGYTPYVSYGKSNFGIDEPGSITICPKDNTCSQE